MWLGRWKSHGKWAVWREVWGATCFSCLVVTSMPPVSIGIILWGLKVGILEKTVFYF